MHCRARSLEDLWTGDVRLNLYSERPTLRVVPKGLVVRFFALFLGEIGGGVTTVGLRRIPLRIAVRLPVELSRLMDPSDLRVDEDVDWRLNRTLGRFCLLGDIGPFGESLLRLIRLDIISAIYLGAKNAA